MREKVYREKLRIDLPIELNPNGGEAFISPLGSQEFGRHQLKIELKPGGSVCLPISEEAAGQIFLSLKTVEEAASGRSAKTDRVLAKAAMKLEEALNHRYQIDLVQGMD